MRSFFGSVTLPSAFGHTSPQNATPECISDPGSSLHANVRRKSLYFFFVSR